MSEEKNDNWFDPDATTFGDRLAGARERAGMSESDLARRLGVKLVTIKAWENDRSEPRSNRLAMLAGMLGVSLPWLMTGEGDGPEVPQESSPVSALLGDIRDIRAQLVRSSDRLVEVEKALRHKLLAETVD